MQSGPRSKGLRLVWWAPRRAQGRRRGRPRVRAQGRGAGRPGRAQGREGRVAPMGRRPLDGG